MDFFKARSEIKHLYEEKQISDDFFNVFCNMLINANIAESEKENLLTTSKDLLSKNIISEDLYDFIFNKIEETRVVKDVVISKKEEKEKSSTSKIVEPSSAKINETPDLVNKILKITPAAPVDTTPTSTAQTKPQEKKSGLIGNESFSTSFSAIGFICAILMMIFAISNLAVASEEIWPLIACDSVIIIGSLVLGCNSVYYLYTKEDYADSNFNFYALCFISFFVGIFFQFLEFDQHYVPTILIILSIITLIGYILGSKFENKYIKLISVILLFIAMALYIIIPFTIETEIEGYKVTASLLFDKNVFYILIIIFINNIASAICNLGNENN